MKNVVSWFIKIRNKMENKKITLTIHGRWIVVYGFLGGLVFRFFRSRFSRWTGIGAPF